METLTSWTTAANLLKSIRPCDIVEFNRITYSHYGFYIGNGICVHVQAPDGSISRSSSSKSSKSDYGTKVAELLTKIAAGDCVRVNNAEFTAFQLDVKRRPQKEAIELALSDLPVDNKGNVILGRSIKVPYFLLSSNNCEGFSTHWRYNHPDGWSIQAANGVVHSTMGTVERISDIILSDAKSILMDNDSAVYKKVTSAIVVAPYALTKISANCVKNVTDFAVKGAMKMFK